MNFCVKYNEKLKCLKEANEIIIPYDRILIKNLSELYPEKTLIIDIHDVPVNKLKQMISEEVDLNFLKNKKCKIMLHYYAQDDIDKLKEYNISYFFKRHIDNWEELQWYKELGVSDMYIEGRLGFELYQVWTVIHPIKIRCIPNICQAILTSHQNLDIKSFFIRPEDLEKNWVIDTIEFSTEVGETIATDTLYNIYFKDKKWMGQLNEIILGLDSDIDSRFILPQFGERRMRCGRECIKGGKCELCDRILELSKTLQKNNLIVKEKKKEEEGWPQEDKN